MNGVKIDKSNLKLKKTHPGRGIRVDIPRLYIGDDRDMLSARLMAASSSNSNPDSQPLLMPCSSAHLFTSNNNITRLKNRN